MRHRVNPPIDSAYSKRRRPAWVASLIKALAVAGLGCLLLGPGIPARAQETGPARVSFIPQWLPQAQFAGYYVAYEKGF
jgi:NitT/TauT family transport system substrate-binding protein